MNEIKVHFVWVGTNIPESVDENIKKWKQQYPNVKLWTDSNIPGEWQKNKWIQDKPPAFKSDYFRMKILEEEGGFFISANAKLIDRPLEKIISKNVDFAVSQEGWYSIGCPFIYSKKNSIILKKIISFYESEPEKIHTINRIIIYFLLSEKITGVEETIMEINDEKILLASFNEYYIETEHSKMISYSFGSWKKDNTSFNEMMNKLQKAKTNKEIKKVYSIKNKIIYSLTHGNMKNFPLFSNLMRKRIYGKDIKILRRINEKN